MTDINKPVTRRSLDEHPKHKRRVIATLGPGNMVGLRLEGGRSTRYKDLNELYDQLELRDAAALAGFDPGPCKNPFKSRNV